MSIRLVYVQVTAYLFSFQNNIVLKHDLLKFNTKKCMWQIASLLAYVGLVIYHGKFLHLCQNRIMSEIIWHDFSLFFIMKETVETKFLFYIETIKRHVIWLYLKYIIRLCYFYFIQSLLHTVYLYFTVLLSKY